MDRFDALQIFVRVVETFLKLSDLPKVHVSLAVKSKLQQSVRLRRRVSCFHDD
jgi:hypothetical protein